MSIKSTSRAKRKRNGQLLGHSIHGNVKIRNIHAMIDMFLTKVKFKNESAEYCTCTLSEARWAVVEFKHKHQRYSLGLFFSRRPTRAIIK